MPPLLINSAATWGSCVSTVRTEKVSRKLRENAKAGRVYYVFIIWIRIPAFVSSLERLRRARRLYLHLPR